MSQFLAIVATFALTFSGMDHFLVRCTLNERIAFAIAVIFGIFCAIFISFFGLPLLVR